MTLERLHEKTAAEVDRWNAAYPVGTPVIWMGAAVTTTTQAFVHGGRPAVLLNLCLENPLAYLDEVTCG